MTKPLFLVTNDDGINSKGIQELADALETIGDVIVIAPEREQSAVSHCISLHKPVRLREIAPNRFACSGTPTDCAYIGLNHVLKDTPPTLVVSGINRGANVAQDVIYSGTVAGAMEALLLGHHGIAFSHHLDGTPVDYAVAAQVARKVVEEWLERHADLKEGVFLNVNFPPGLTADTPWKITELGIRNYAKEVTQGVDPRGKPYFWIGGTFLGWDDLAKSDCNALRDGFVSVTPVHMEMTCTAGVKQLEQWTIFNKDTP